MRSPGSAARRCSDSGLADHSTAIGARTRATRWWLADLAAGLRVQPSENAPIGHPCDAIRRALCRSEHTGREISCRRAADQRAALHVCAWSASILILLIVGDTGHALASNQPQVFWSVGAVRAGAAVCARVRP